MVQNMAILVWLTALICLTHILSPACAQSCQKTYSGKTFETCEALKLGATLAWTLNKGANSIDFAFSDAAPSSAGWVGWGINPTGTKMVGTQSLIAFKNSTSATVLTYPITSYTGQLVPGSLSVRFTNYSTVIAGTQMTIFTTLVLQTNQSLALNHVWNVGSSVDLSTNAPAPHSFANDNILSYSSINMSTGTSQIVELPHQKLKVVHSFLNAVSWGILLPVGVMAARYLRPFSAADPAWFYIHVTCQTVGYALGVAGWGTGIQLQNYNKNAIYYKHRNLGISIFVLATLQVLAIVLRPKKDHKVRPYWNIYHHVVGYTTIIIIIVNIFEGINIFQPENKWRTAYAAILTSLGAISLLLEIITWTIYFRRPKDEKPVSHNQFDSSFPERQVV